jgi:hypothetical protein
MQYFIIGPSSKLNNQQRFLVRPRTIHFGKKKLNSIPLNMSPYGVNQLSFNLRNKRRHFLYIFLSHSRYATDSSQEEEEEKDDKEGGREKGEGSAPYGNSESESDEEDDLDSVSVIADRTRDRLSGTGSTLSGHSHDLSSHSGNSSHSGTKTIIV